MLSRRQEGVVQGLWGAVMVATPVVFDCGGRNRVSATTFCSPATCRMSLVNSATELSCRHWQAVHGSASLERAKVSSLWSVFSVNRWPYSM